MELSQKLTTTVKTESQLFCLYSNEISICILHLCILQLLFPQSNNFFLDVSHKKKTLVISHVSPLLFQKKNQSFIYLLLWSAVVVTSSGVDFITVHSNGHKLISSVGFYWGNCGISAVVLMFELTQRSSQTSSSRFHISCNI